MWMNVFLILDPGYVLHAFFFIKFLFPYLTKSPNFPI